MGNTWREWWRSDAAPRSWPAPHSALAAAVRWRRASEGVEWSEIQLRGAGEAWRTRVVLARIDPTRVRFRLDTAYSSDRTRAAWTIERTPADAALAVNAGQFVHSMPWGWVVLAGREYLSPGSGPLSMAVAFDSSGAVQFLPAAALALAPAERARGVAYAFQSYPMLLEEDARVPRALLDPAGGIDLGHRDSRLALGILRDGHLLLALTRFDALGDVLGAIPFGLTTPEMSALMGGLGCRVAVMLDGGISGQLALRDSTGKVHRWTGIRPVPLALVVLPR